MMLIMLPLYNVQLAIAKPITKDNPDVDHILAHVTGNARLEKLVYLKYESKSGTMPCT